jgi:hypothetical protein
LGTGVSKGGPEVYGRSGFPDAAFLINNGDDLVQIST